MHVEDPLLALVGGVDVAVASAAGRIAPPRSGRASASRSNVDRGADVDVARAVGDLDAVERRRCPSSSVDLAEADLAVERDGDRAAARLVTG